MSVNTEIQTLDFRQQTFLNITQLPHTLTIFV
jgi:hypothetical protein